MTSINGTRHSAGVRLSGMMFLQFAVWGVWLPPLANYLVAPPGAGGLGFTGTQIGWLLGLAGSIGALAAPFIAGQWADRKINAERALAILLLLGGAVKIVTAYQTSYTAWLWLSILYSVLYMPTLALTNSIAFANLDDPEKKFPPVRALGTIGWIVASVAFAVFWLKTDWRFVPSWPFIDGDARPDEVARIVDALIVSGVVSIGYALYAVLALPRTPPKREAREPLAFAQAFALFKRMDFSVLTLSALLISMIHQCYFMRTGPYLQTAIGTDAADVAPIMAIGQVSEIVVLAVLGWFLKSLGYKVVLLLGAVSYAARYALFAVEPSVGVVQSAMLLHGLNYGFFFAGSFLYVERIASPSIRHSAQTVFGIVILGVGPVLAGLYNGSFDHFTDPAGDGQIVQSYNEFWWTQTAVAGLSCVLLAVFFRSRAGGAGRELAPDPDQGLANRAAEA